MMKMKFPIIVPTTAPKHTESMMVSYEVMNLPSLRQEVIVGKSGEVISRRGLATERLTVTDFLDIAEAASHPFVAVGVESVEVQRYPGIAAGIHFATVENGLNRPVHDLRSCSRIGVDELSRSL